jgi:hypothetical protein
VFLGEVLLCVSMHVQSGIEVMRKENERIKEATIQWIAILSCPVASNTLYSMRRQENGNVASQALLHEQLQLGHD